MNEILNAFGVNWKLLVIQMVNFGILLTILYYFLYRPLLGLLEERRVKINKGLLDAEEAEVKVQKIEDEKEGIINAAHKEGEQLVVEAKTRAIEQERILTHTATEKSDKILRDARKKADADREQILSESRNELAKIAVLGAAKILKTSD